MASGPSKLKRRCHLSLQGPEPYLVCCELWGGVDRAACDCMASADYHIAGNFHGIQFSRLTCKPRKLNPRNKNSPRTILLTVCAWFAGSVVIMLYVIGSRTSRARCLLTGLQWIVDSVMRDICAISPSICSIVTTGLTVCPLRTSRARCLLTGLQWIIDSVMRDICAISPSICSIVTTGLTVCPLDEPTNSLPPGPLARQGTYPMSGRWLICLCQRL